MEQNQWEIVILKPTAVFLSFLYAQLPTDVELPDLALLRTDTTAYTIPKHDDEEQTLNEIEKNYPIMFRHEIQRWLGDDIKYDIEGSFIDFLCCFKFEMHSQIVLMEPSIKEGAQLVRVKPRTVMLKWMKSTVQKEEDKNLAVVLDHINVTQLAENATIIIKNFAKLNQIKPFLKNNWEPIFQAEMLRMCDDATLWPEINSFESFVRYFSADIHTKLIHLH